MKRMLLWLLGVVALLCLVGALGFHWWFRHFLESDGCRQWVASTINGALHASGELLPIQASENSLYSDGYAARNSLVFRTFQADQIRAETRFGYWDRSCVVDRLEIARLRMDLRDSTSAVSESPVRPQPKGSAPWRETGFKLRQLAIENLELGLAAGNLKGMRLTALPDEQAPGDWLLAGRDGALKLEVLPAGLMDWKVETCEARVHGGTLFLTSARLRCCEHGELTVDGEIMPSNAASAKWHSAFSGVPVAPWLSPDWRARLTGNIAGHLDVSASPDSPADELLLQGEISLSDGQLTALPILDQIAAVTHSDGFRQMRFRKASARISRLAGVWTVTNFTTESEGLAKLQGSFTIKAGQIEGVIQAGVAPSTLEWIPGARERVFTVSRDGYLWTPVRLSGPIAHPSEDLTARLAQAATVQSINEVRQSVRDSARGLLDLVTPLIPAVPSLP